jgi:hypothetical protein
MAGKSDAINSVILAVRKTMDKHHISVAQAIMVWNVGLQTIERRKRRAQRALAAKEKAIVRRLKRVKCTAC